MAMIIMNFERSFKGAKIAAGTPIDIATVVMSEANRNQRIKFGIALVRENLSFVLSFFEIVDEGEGKCVVVIEISLSQYVSFLCFLIYTL